MRACLSINRSTAVVALLGLVVVAAGGCGKGPLSDGAGPRASAAPGAGPVTPSPGAGPVTPSPGPGPASPSPLASTPVSPAADQLAGFFSAAGAADARIKAAAAAINGATSASRMVFTDDVLASIRSAGPAAVAAAIPPGLPAVLLRPVLVVYNDLVSRRAAFNDVVSGTFAPAGPEAARIGRCLASGAPAAAQYAADLALAKATAASLPPFTPASAASRAAGEVAVLAAWIRGWNNGCGRCGGYVVRDVPAVTWLATPTPATVDPTQLANGKLGDLSFRATYELATGWQVILFAC